MDVLLTGASGFIGHYVLQELLSRNMNVTCLSRSPINIHADNLTVIPFDISKDLVEHLPTLPKRLIHLAWQGLPNYKEDFHLSVNLVSQKKFLHDLIQRGVQDITITGTCMEYGMQSGCLHEELPPAPDTPYAQAKNELRIFIENDFPQINFKWVRLFYVFGQGQNPQSIIPQLWEAFRQGSDVFNMSEGEQIRDYLPVEKMAHYIVQIAFQNEIKGIINCCSGTPVKLKDFIEDYKKKNNLDITLNLGYYPYPVYEPMEFWGDIRKLNKIIHYAPKREI